MENQIPEDVTKDRFNRLLKEVQDIAHKRAGMFENTVQEVLVEELNEHDAEMVTGRMSNNMLVHFKGGEELIGTLQQIRLKECKGFYYLGEL
jgi:tRNA-2-methylthio-N6-dimethylallyladenosine synthase